LHLYTLLPAHALKQGRQGGHTVDQKSSAESWFTDPVFTQLCSETRQDEAYNKLFSCKFEIACHPDHLHNSAHCLACFRLQQDCTSTIPLRVFDRTAGRNRLEKLPNTTRELLRAV